ncbi:pre-mRNA 3'-end-processing factor FIP1-like isoform X7 [Lepus europaeus]|uniref:pre-mRNA 3'-end-processing factor FIP1-like isoform X7 n=1 Tax=Lepus europaeus TaxID=9983 RepID=UPI002B491964|nr:pre-mRNA 3'-end-processing factor FIP1-like isoform X7 [Lepus europaeus]
MKLKGQKKKIPVLILHLGLKMKPLKMAYQNRRLPGAIDVIGQTITISRVEGRRRANENSNIQVLSERCAAEVDNNFSKPPPFFPPGGPPTHLPPPPFLPPPPTVSTAPPLIPPPVLGAHIDFHSYVRAHGLHDGSKEWIDWPAKGYEELFVNLPLVCACAVGYLGSRM